MKKTRREEKQQGMRDNEHKPKWSYVDFQSLLPLVQVLEYGANKYAPNNWKKGLSVTETCESMLRHTFAFMNGENTDKESQLHHIGHIMANAMFISWMLTNLPEHDDRNQKQ